MTAIRHTATAGLVALLPIFAGCASYPGVAVPPGYEDLEPCPPAQIRVETLETIGEPGCDLTGSMLIVSGWSDVTVPGVGEGFSLGDGAGRELMISNWGVPGIGVAEVIDGVVVALWATSPDAMDLHRELLAIGDILAGHLRGDRRPVTE